MARHEEEKADSNAETVICPKNSNDEDDDAANNPKNIDNEPGPYLVMNSQQLTGLKRKDNCRCKPEVSLNHEDDFTNPIINSSESIGDEKKYRSAGTDARNVISLKRRKISGKKKLILKNDENFQGRQTNMNDGSELLPIIQNQLQQRELLIEDIKLELALSEMMLKNLGLHHSVKAIKKKYKKLKMEHTDLEEEMNNVSDLLESV